MIVQESGPISEFDIVSVCNEKEIDVYEWSSFE